MNIETKRNKLTKKQIIKLIILVLIVAIISLLIYGNYTFEVNNYTIKSSRLPESFDGFKILQISDLHNDEYGDDNERLIKAIRDEEPDIIVITGDYIDRNQTDVDVAIKLSETLVDIAPCYYIRGNHELRVKASDSSEYERLISSMKDIGVNVLIDEEAVLTRNGESISLVGYDDVYNSDVAVTCDYKIALNHYPENSQDIAEAGFDVIFSGHAHGGLIRLPFIGGIYAPGQGMFPEYDSGTYSIEDTTLVVSRGIGNSGRTLRLFNRPELVTVTLKCEN